MSWNTKQIVDISNKFFQVPGHILRHTPMSYSPVSGTYVCGNKRSGFHKRRWVSEFWNTPNAAIWSPTLIKRHHHHFPPWIRSFDLFRHRRIAIVSWGVHDLFFLEVCSWGRVSAVWCCLFFQGGWSSFVCIWVSRLVFQRSLVLFLWLRFLFHPVLCIP